MFAYACNSKSVLTIVYYIYSTNSPSNSWLESREKNAITMELWNSFTLLPSALVCTTTFRHFPTNGNESLLTDQRQTKA